MKSENKMSFEELEKFKEVNLEFNKDIININEGICPKCNENMIKYVDNKDLFDGVLTFHIIKFKCPKCKKEYLDLEEAQKYDLFLMLERMGKNRVLSMIKQKSERRIRI